MNVIWTEPAATALESIQDYIARDNPHAAWNLAQKIKHAVALLPDNPKLGHKHAHSTRLEINTSPARLKV
ncbi:MAG TPA: type II toxin-antitoxin system RelE/ParE family toxin [Chromatiales bacterium]|nr:type II toxin-antitoxin system RelE/ParE family toxin [Chromatiales bacterium]HEX22531.1 type II toxin-antitoxin system RelE/ParE family toxin [Chromatiales bacterium]